MTTYDDDNPFGLSPQERRVLRHWQNGDTMIDAYSKVMLSPYDIQSISKRALEKRVEVFFDTFRLREAMAATPGERGEKARKDLERWRLTLGDTASEDIAKKKRNFKPKGEGKKKKKKKVECEEEFDDDSFEKQQAIREMKALRKAGTDREKWLESLNISENPNAMTIYGTGQFLAYMAVKEIMARQDEIRRRGISVLDKNGSVFTSTLISALKTAAAMVLPFAPAPTSEDRKQMSKAAVLLGLFPDKITESPDDYTAPPPTTDIELESDGDN